MANEAERVVVELLAKVDGFDGKVKQSAAAFGGAMKTVEASATSAEKTVVSSTNKIAQAEKTLATAMGQTAAASRTASTAVAAHGTAVQRSAGAAQQATRVLGQQIADVGTQLSSGTSPFLILAQQGPQVANALDGAKGKLAASRGVDPRRDGLEAARNGR